MENLKHRHHRHHRHRHRHHHHHHHHHPPPPPRRDEAGSFLSARMPVCPRSQGSYNSSASQAVTNHSSGSKQAEGRQEGVCVWQQAGRLLKSIRPANKTARSRCQAACKGCQAASSASPSSKKAGRFGPRHIDK